MYEKKVLKMQITVWIEKITTITQTTKFKKL